MTAPTSDATDAAEAKPSFAYVIGHDGSNVVKIGKADDVLERLASIQRMSPVALRVLAQFDGGYTLETALHRRFKHLRTHGEWFDFGDLDPVAEVTHAIPEIEAEQAAKREAEERRQLRTEEPVSWAPFIIRGRTLVYSANLGSSPESARCVARTKSGKRCASWLENGQSTGWWKQWSVPGYGTLTCDVIGECDVKETEADRWLAQRCRKHADPDWPAFCGPEWEVYDPDRHIGLLDKELPVIPGWGDRPTRSTP